MFSNWRGKMYLAAETGNRHLAFMSLVSFKAMISEIGSEVKTDSYDVFGGYDGSDLKNTAENFDEVLNGYLKEYKKAEIKINRYADIDEFAGKYEK